MDLTELFGEGWCVTVARGAVAEVLIRMGVTGAAEVPEALDLATRRLVDGAGPGVLLLGRDVGAGCVMVVELEGTTGWVGLNAAVLAALSACGGVAVSACEDPDQLVVQVARDGTEQGWLDVVTGRRFGDGLGTAGEALSAAGFPADAEGAWSGEAAGLGLSDRVVLALRAVTGIQLDEGIFDGPWFGGVSTAGV